MNRNQEIIHTVLKYYPAVQAIYLYGSYGTDAEWPDSDVDIALLLPPEQAKKAGSLIMSDLQNALVKLLHKDIDLINLRLVSTVLQKEIVFADRRIYCRDDFAVDEFEMLVLSFYQHLNQKRKDILEAFRRTRRAFPV